MNKDLILVPRDLFCDLISAAEMGRNSSLPKRQADRNFIHDTLQAAIKWDAPTVEGAADVVLPLKELEAFCGFSPHLRPSCDACLGKSLPDGRTVVSICFEYEPGKVRATLR